MGSPIVHGLLRYSLMILPSLAIAQVSPSFLIIATPTVPAKVLHTHTISVGNGDHKFRPEITQAEIGDTIEFQFFPANHSVVRAEYQYPCIPYEMTGLGKIGFFTGFHPVDAILSEPPKWSVIINDTDPIFFYCSATGSCINYQMVGVINPNATVSLATQKNLAGKSSYMLQPGEDFPPESPPSSLPSSAAVSPGISTSTPSPTSTAASSPSATAAPAAPHGLSIPIIVGIAIAGVAALALAAALFFFIGRWRTLKQEWGRANSHNTHKNIQPPGDTLHNFPPRNSDMMSNGSTRTSSAVLPGGMPYGGTYNGHESAAFQSPKFEYRGLGTEDAYAGSTTGSPGLGYGRNMSNHPMNISPGAPLRHPSVFLNPDAPRELHAPDGRYVG